MNKVVFYIALMGLSIGAFAQNKFELNVEVIDAKTNTFLESAEVIIEPCQCGGVTDSKGFFEIELVEDDYNISIAYIGYRTEQRNIRLDRDRFIRVELNEETEELEEIVLSAKSLMESIESPQMGALYINTLVMKKLPAVAGEYDILKSMTMLSGITNSGEISNGLSVRGGTLDQNLLLFEYAPVFNATHLFGLFSVFTPEAVSSVNLYRANIPSRYGGRSTSVLDLRVANPLVEKPQIKGSLGIVSSHLSVQTPLIENKLYLGAHSRVGFTDFLLPLFSKRLQNSKANFYDATIKLQYLAGVNDQISLTAFRTNDFYQLDLISKIDNINSDINQYDFSTSNYSLNWTHSFSDDAYLKTIAVNSFYSPKTIFPDNASDNEVVYSSSIGYQALHNEYYKTVSDRFKYYIGQQSILYDLEPGTLAPGSSLSVKGVELANEKASLLSPYANVEFAFSDKLRSSVGLRLNRFDLDADDAESNATNELELNTTYYGVEPRLGISWNLTDNSSIKMSFARLHQYLQNIYNSTTPLPTSRWKLSDAYIKPQSSNSYGLGYYQSLRDGEVDFSIEAYYRNSANNLTYKPGADFFLEPRIQDEIIQADGKAYGVELNLAKTQGKVNGWVNYTYSRSFLRSFAEKLGDRVNNNKWYASDFDRPHILNATINLEGDIYNTWSFNATYQSGRPYTVANSIVDIQDLTVPIFIERNNSRLRPYYRFDFSWKVKYGKKVNRRWVGDWTFTIYNITGRKNPFNLYYEQRQANLNTEIFLDSPLGSYELAVLNSPILALTYNFVFD